MTPSKTTWSALDLALGTLVVSLAGWLRLGWPGVNNFGFDEAYLSRLALEAAAGRIPAVGMPASVPIPNFPGAAWLMALPYLLSSDPLVATLFVGLANVAAVGGVFYLARQGWGRTAAATAGLLAAASSPWVLHSRSIWAQNLMAPLATLWAVAAFAGLIRARPGGLFLFGFLGGFAFQVHYSGLTLGAASLLLIGLFRPRKHRWALAAGFAAAALAAAPFVITALCCRPEIIAGLREMLGRPATVDAESLRQWVGLIRGDDNLGGGWLGVDLTGSITLALVALGLARLGVGAFKDPDPVRRPNVIILAWALTPPVFFLAHPAPLYANYQLMVLPSAAIAAGVSANFLPGRWTVLIPAAALVVAASQAAGLADGFHRLATGLPVDRPFSRPLFLVREAAGTVRDGRPVVVIAPGDAPEFDPEPAIFDVLLWDYPHRIVDGRSALIIPNGEANLLVTSPGLPALEELQAAGPSAFRRAEFGRGGWPPVLALTVNNGQPPGFAPFGPVPLAGDTEYLGYRWRQVGDRWRLSSLWRVGRSRPGEILLQFHHLRAGDENGPVITTQDVRVSSGAWRGGDLVIVWADFGALPGQGPFWVDTGLYQYPEIRRVDRLDQPMNPQGPIRLGPFYTD